MSNNDENGKHRTADVGSQRIARVYAEALLNSAEQPDSVLEELESLVRDVFPADRTFEGVLQSAAIGRHAKEHVLQQVFGGRASKPFFNFLMVLNNHDRLDLLRPILSEARDLRDQRARRIRVLVKSAVPLADAQRQRLTSELKQTFQLEPVLEAQVDADLLGGMVVRVGDWLFDGSVRTKIDNLKQQLIERSSHEIQSGRNRFGDW